ncbi:hypothetical protein MBRU_07560 [Mycolicibacterium brumae DSM 44177]|nr:hypothetical protein MBRU_07560 [Mycolicibacterium brumae DSM 44177]
MVNNSGARESPFWSYMADNGFGYLDAQRVSNDSKIVCANRQAGVTPAQITGLLESRGYTNTEAQGIVAAEQASSTSVHSVC